ncbi:acetylornithine deacetylase [Alkalicoccobacillus porphyridii]|uniref:Acetylornithine deacetylase n=1 Tax=Alkalicoccobacillus porphyridii TaxID=2597270 RepID=A0A553ZZH7_9BACI|nr:acetylornithine deacetylase [Alkalicoccobacillus porphyridii]TSB46841.1 acetylornithine deacetylase [Alkalicoccobacillus porphyridii]
MSSLIDLLSQVDEREDELTALVQKLVSYQTVSPPARNSASIQSYIAQYLTKLSYTVNQWDVYPGDPNVVATRKGQMSNDYQSLILNGHVDVASISEDEPWETPPFEAVINQRHIYGRGTADMKGGLAACLFALKLLHESNYPLNGDLILQSVVGEEAGEAGTKQCCERGYTADFAIVADTSQMQIQGQGGVITGWITLQSPTTHHDAQRRQMIHAGGQLQAASTIEKMAKLIGSLQELERHWAVTKHYPGFQPGTNTINPAVIEGGRHAAFIADKCSLWITVHFYPNESYDTVAKEIEEHVLATAAADPWMKEHPPTFLWGGNSMIEERGEVFPSLSIDEESLAINMLKRAHHHILKTEALISMSPSVNDGGWLGDAGIPTAIYGPGQLAHAHAVNERISIDELVQYTKTILTFITSWCNTKREKK